ncbi:condensation domain-containing protein [Nonomuraea polychroma]|uniref:Condensation domain-containing protein n=1 Tax=Nonomuraea polychroma TaxID=46176 RepID=A0A438LXD2_9ACTN|nr:condensation domain-containing protein [Nonomuraea polychroma]RVX38111.1 condensation domain-containing protein [Nonomuraea polychroma]
MTEVSFAQHGMWITERMGAASAYHMPIVIRLPGPPDRGVLAKAVAAVVERHPLLGTAVEERDGVLHLVPARTPPALADAPVEGPFDLERGPLVRFALDGRTLLVEAHHLVFDGQSKDILVADLAAFCEGAVPPPLETIDHAALQRERVAARLGHAKEFWAERWREPGHLAVPGGVLRSRKAGPGKVSEFRLEVPEVTGLTRFEVILAALHTLLRSYGNAGVVTAVDLSTRTEAEAGHIGPFVNELPVFSRPSPDTPFAEFAAGLRAELRQVYAVREVPIARAVPGVKPHAALAPVSVSYRRAGPPVPGWDVDLLAFNKAVRGALQLQLLDGPDGLRASLRHDPDELAEPDLFAADLRSALSRIGPDLLLSELAPFREVSTPNAPAAGTEAVEVAADPLLPEITAIWEEVLKFSPVEPHDDIFDLGGHSLTITQIIARMRKRLDVEIELDDFFDNPTIAGVIEVIRR